MAVFTNLWLLSRVLSRNLWRFHEIFGVFTKSLAARAVCTWLFSRVFPRDQPYRRRRRLRPKPPTASAGSDDDRRLRRRQEAPTTPARQPVAVCVPVIFERNVVNEGRDTIHAKEFFRVSRPDSALKFCQGEKFWKGTARPGLLALARKSTETRGNGSCASGR